MAVRKIDLMHRMFGKTGGQFCKDCDHLCKVSYDRTYYKCEVYGESRSDATDWVLKYPACGLFNKETNCKDIVRLVRSATYNPEHENSVLEGQLSFEEG